MPVLRRRAWMYCALFMAFGTGVACAQQFPNQTIRIIAGAAGGSIDVSARVIAQGLTEALGQQTIVENRGSAGGVIAVQTVTKARPDGYTLLLYGSNVWLWQFMVDNVTWDPMRDLAPITLAISAPHVLVIHPLLPVKSVADLIALAKARPGELNDCSIGAGNATHMAGELFKSMAGVNIVRIPYKNSAMQITDLISGQVQMSFITTGAAMANVKAGRLRALAVTSAQSSALVPGVPTVAASGLPGYEAVSIYGMFAPAQTPAAVISRLNREVVRVLNAPSSKERLFSAGVEGVGSSPEQLTAAIKADIAKWGKLIKDLGIRGN
ncbi:MAG: tripartite tricarboxylate transporter substrate binding protein [Betaproteobacteria bacterium]|nr:tripartite tricarboxylate transporter substrate binding protein [Betaproteobacteria bacterium]MBI3054063.1 tripartite tricarboxylate transporter substrate binding protein [Betaproteobacteria bacterium]